MYIKVSSSNDSKNDLLKRAILKNYNHMTEILFQLDCDSKPRKCQTKKYIIKIYTSLQLLSELKYLDYTAAFL